MKSLIRFLVFLTAASQLLVSAANAQEFPTKSLSIVVPYPVGGPYDIAARQVSELARNALTRPIIVESRPGGATIIATKAVQTSQPDGHSILLQTGSMGMNSILYKDVGYAFTDFIPLVSVANHGYVLFVNSSFPASNLKELLAYAKANEAKLNIGDFGTQGAVQALTDQLNAAGNMKITQITYKGATDMTQALVANDIQMAFLAVGPGKPLVDAGKLKAIAISSEKRSPMLPDTPTFHEAGVPIRNGTTYLALFVRKETPPAAIEKLRAAIRPAIQSPEFRQRLEPIGLDVWDTDAASLLDAVNKDFEFWKSVLQK